MINKKICRLCQKLKETNVNNLCFDCNSYLNKKYYYENKNNILKRSKINYKKNQKKVLISRKKRYESDIEFRFQKKAISRIKNIFKNSNIKPLEILGCNKRELLGHLLRTYLINYNVNSKNFNLEDFINCEIDHIIPLGIVKNKKDKIKLCNFENLQLLNHNDHFKKHKNHLISNFERISRS